MSKSVLVLDEMPKGCDTCPLRAWTERSGEPYCTVGPDNNFLHYEDNFVKGTIFTFDDTPPKWCPLREIKDGDIIVIAHNGGKYIPNIDADDFDEEYEEL